VSIGMNPVSGLERNQWRGPELSGIDGIRMGMDGDNVGYEEDTGPEGPEPLHPVRTQIETIPGRSIHNNEDTGVVGMNERKRCRK
jgi:hypothetical protein